MKVTRRNYILAELNKFSYVKVADLQKALGVTEMTVRRDLQELEDEGLLLRVHGGAQKTVCDSITPEIPNLLTLEHDERKGIHIEEKKLIAKKAASLIQDGEVVFIGASTTNEQMVNYITAKNIRIVTNCLYIFFQYYKNDNVDAILIGGKYNEFIQSFLGPITSEGLKNITFTKAFVGTNAITDNHIYASNDEEGLLHKRVLDNAQEKYVVCDSSKFNQVAFFNFYNCDQLSAIITDKTDFDKILEYRERCNIV